MKTDHCKGYYLWTYDPGCALTDANLGIAFSGYADIHKALDHSAPILQKLAGARFLCIGGGGAPDGFFTSTALAKLNKAISGGLLSGYQGVAYDVEVGESGLSASFCESFNAAKQMGLKVLVTVSHSAPYGIGDAFELMQSFFADTNVDCLSPQLYTKGDESANQWATSAGVTWDQYATAEAAVVPSLVQASYYADAEQTFKTHGVTTEGFVQWQQTS